MSKFANADEIESLHFMKRIFNVQTLAEMSRREVPVWEQRTAVLSRANSEMINATKCDALERSDYQPNKLVESCWMVVNRA